VTNDATPDESAAEGSAEAPARKRSPRRSTRAATSPGAAAEASAAGASTPDAPDAGEAPATDTSQVGDAGGPAKKAPTRTRRKVTADAPQGTSDQSDTKRETKPDAKSGAESAQSPSVRVGGTPRLASTAVLFQAPEPTARPRRRVEAPAGPPRPVDAGPVGDQQESVGDRQGEPDRGPDGDREQDEGGPRRRRRGGRGRGKQDADDRGDDRKDDRPEDTAEDRAGEEAEEGGQSGTETEAPKGRGGRGKGGGRSSSKAKATEGEGGGRSSSKGKAAEGDGSDASEDEDAETREDSPEGEGTSASSRRRRRRRRSRGESGDEPAPSERQRGRGGRTGGDEVTALRGSTRLEAKRQRRREGRDAGRRRATVTEAEFLARRESVERGMVVREAAGRVQIAVLEDGVLVEHYVSRAEQNSQAPMAGNVYLGRVQNVLPSMEAAFVDIGKGRNAVLYAGEVNWDAAGMEGQPRRIEQAMKSGDSVLAQVTKDPVGHKGARLTSQITLAGRYLVYVPGGGMTGISRKLPDNERARLKKILKEIVPDDAGVIVRTAAEGASDEELRRDVTRLQEQWTAIEKKAKTASPPALLQGEPDLAIRVVRDIFNDDFSSLVVQGEGAWSMISGYVSAMAPDLADRVRRWDGDGDVFAAHRIDEQLGKGMDRKVWLPSGGSLVIDRTEAMTVIDVNTGKFTGSGGTLEETVTRNNLEAAEELVRQLRLRDIGGIIVIDFIDMVLESNRDLVLRRLVECLGRDRTKHQVAEVTSLGLVQMTRKRVGQGLIEAFSETCQHCNGRGFIVHTEPVDPKPTSESDGSAGDGEPKRSRRKKVSSSSSSVGVPVLPEAREAVKATLATIAAAAAHAHEHEREHAHEHAHDPGHDSVPEVPDVAPEASEGAPVGEVPDVAPEPFDGDRVPEAAATELADVVESVEAVEGAPGSSDDEERDPSADSGAEAAPDRGEATEV